MLLDLQLPPTNGLLIVGIVGIASVLVGILYFQPNILDNITSKKPYVTITIEGLLDTYKVGEPIDFLFIVEGYGCDSGFPTVSIKRISEFENQTHEEMVKSRFGEIRHFPADVSCPTTDIYQARHIGDVQKYSNDEQERQRIRGSVPIIIDIEGNYVVQIGNSEVKQFRIVKGN